MKSIAVFAATLMLGAGTALAASPSQPATAPQAMHQHQHQATAVRTGAADRETQALNLLEAKGYGGFTNFRPAGNDFTATVTREGRTMNVQVNPQSGQVTTAG